MFSDRIDELFNAQLNEWELAGTNYRQLEKVKTRQIDFDGFQVLIQFNPERIRSSAAKVDSKSIEARLCFLCEVNRPDQQRGAPFENEFTVLVNPFPIFKRHLTIPSERHTGQLIGNNFGKMLKLAEALPAFTIFYNGPQCGASAPDHFHFQAGNRGFMPVESDFSGGTFTTLLSAKPGIEIWKWKSYLRGIITLKGKDKEKLNNVFRHFFDKFSILQPDRPEPMVNILAYHAGGDWIVHIIPRKLHRPSQFFAEGSAQIILSPASVDLGGVIITPREEDFHKISRTDVADIFTQVCLKEDELPGFFSEII